MSNSQKQTGLSYRALLIEALNRVENPESDAKTLLSSLIDHRQVLTPMKSMMRLEPPELRLVRPDSSDV